jgi:hypothetical protein
MPLFELKAEFARGFQEVDTESSSIATFKILTCGPHWYDSTHGFYSDEQRGTTMLSALSSRDSEFQDWSETNIHCAFHTLCISFANCTAESYYVNDPDAKVVLPNGRTYFLEAVWSSNSGTEEVSDDEDDSNVELSGKTNNEYTKAGHLSFNWKTLMDSHFKEEIFVRQQAAKLDQTSKAKVDIVAAIEEAKAAMTSKISPSCIVSSLLAATGWCCQ